MGYIEALDETRQPRAKAGIWRRLAIVANCTVEAFAIRAKAVAGAGTPTTIHSAVFCVIKDYANETSEV